jgi:hypothetical protein
VTGRKAKTPERQAADAAIHKRLNGATRLQRLLFASSFALGIAAGVMEVHDHAAVARVTAVGSAAIGLAGWGRRERAWKETADTAFAYMKHNFHRRYPELVSEVQNNTDPPMPANEKAAQPADQGQTLRQKVHEFVGRPALLPVFATAMMGPGTYLATTGQLDPDRILDLNIGSPLCLLGIMAQISSTKLAGVHEEALQKMMNTSDQDGIPPPIGRPN